MDVWIAWPFKLRLAPRPLGLARTHGTQQQIGDPRPRAWIIIQVAIPPSLERLAHRSARLVEPAQLLVSVRELLQLLDAKRRRGRQRQRQQDQPHAGTAVIALARDIQLLLDRFQVVHAATANADNRPIADSDPNPHDPSRFQGTGFCPTAALP